VTRVAVFTAVDLEARTLARLLGLPALAGDAWPHFGAGALELISVGPRARLLEARAARLTPPELRPGDLVVPDVVLGPAGERFATLEVAGLPRAGALAGVTDVVETPAAKARLWVETRALACDMESAVILAWARARGIPAAVIRGVSDPADRGVPADLAAVVEPDGRVRTARAVRAVLARPRAIADAMTLRSGTGAGLQAVARALGLVARARA